MKLQQQLLAVQLLALAVTFAGELAGLWALVTVGVAGFFLALAALFVQMTADLVLGVRDADRHATVR
jgi:hypothetical protein